MATRSVATVFGGSGFLGRYVVRRLAQKGYVVRVAVRDPMSAGFLKTMGVVGQIVPLFAPLNDEPAVHRAVQGAALVVNLVGILAERRKGDFQRVHVEGAERVARLAAAAGVLRLVHVSAIGADPASPSRYGASKAAGEAGGAAGLSGGDAAASFDRVRAGGPVLQSLRLDGADAAGDAGDCRRDAVPAGLCRRTWRMR